MRQVFLSRQPNSTDSPSHHLRTGISSPFSPTRSTARLCQNPLPWHLQPPLPPSTSTRTSSDSAVFANASNARYLIFRFDLIANRSIAVSLLPYWQTCPPSDPSTRPLPMNSYSSPDPFPVPRRHTRSDANLPVCFPPQSMPCSAPPAFSTPPRLIVALKTLWP